MSVNIKNALVKLLDKDTGKIETISVIYRLAFQLISVVRVGGELCYHFVINNAYKFNSLYYPIKRYTIIKMVRQ